LGGDRAPLSHRRLEERAVREGWPITPSIRARVLQRLCNTVDPDHVWDGEKPGHREAIAASRTILAADRLNLAREVQQSREKGRGFKLSDVVAEAEAAADSFRPAERPAGK
jgi:hypothetical protein